MASFQEVQNVCVFCYKSISSSDHTDSKAKITKFIDFLTRLDEGKWTENKLQFKQVFTKIPLLGKALECCKDCCRLIDSYCDLYHQIKCLELKLNWKLDTLGKKIELANKIPTRWVNFKKALQMIFQDEMEKIEESHIVIRTIRNTVVNSGLQGSVKSQPRVVIKRVTEHFRVLDEQNCDLSNDEDNECQSNNTNDSVSADIPGSNISVVKKYVSCEICQKLVPPRCLKQHHNKNHGPNKPSTQKSHLFKCKSSGCSAYFLKKRQLSAHFLDEHIKGTKVDPETADIIDGVEYFQCKICKVSFPELASLRRHVSSSKLCRPKGEKENSGIKIECVECKINFKTNLKLWLHQNQAHSNGNKTVCPQCGKSVRKWDFNVHAEFHKSPKDWKYKCGECGKKFPTSAQLSRHKKSHKKKIESNINRDTDSSEDDYDIEADNEEYESKAINTNDHMIETKLEFPNISIAENENRVICENSRNSGSNDETVVKMEVDGDMGDNDERVQQLALEISGGSLESTTGIEDGMEDSCDDLEMENSRIKEEVLSDPLEI